ncbi:MAG: hypothetical protein JW739_06720 [Opitutales bacterium]|nr:hypothetical protein [Opitutales bacterium]
MNIPIDLLEQIKNANWHITDIAQLSDWVKQLEAVLKQIASSGQLYPPGSCEEHPLPVSNNIDDPFWISLQDDQELDLVTVNASSETIKKYLQMSKSDYGWEGGKDSTLTLKLKQTS